MGLIDRIRRTFAGEPFGDPVPPEDIAAAEAALGHPLPAILRELYASFDGFAGFVGTPFLFPLLRPSPFSQESLMSFTLFLRREPYFPRLVHDAVAIGYYGSGTAWLIRLDHPEQIVRWHPEWGDDYEILDGSIFDVWQSEKLLYDSLPGSVSRSLTDDERTIVLKLVGDDFAEIDKVKQQLETATVSALELPQCLTLVFSIASSERIEVKSPDLGEGTIEDIDGVPILLALLQKNGQLWQLDVHRADGGPIRTAISPDRLRAPGHGQGLALG